MPHAKKPLLIKRSGIDRRSGEDKRKVYSLDYFKNNGMERRLNIKDRRKKVEPRKSWDRVNKWYSIYIDRKN